MTVSYTAEVATCKGFGCFLKLLFRWKGSIYKLVWPDLFFFLGTYFALNILYRFFLDAPQQKFFEQICVYCEKYSNLIPVSFVLGFYVSIVVGRWWDQYKTIPWPDPIAVYVSASIHGQDEKGRMMRRTIMRYCCLSLTMCFALISARVKKRFPTLDHLIEAGLLLENEKLIIEDLNRSVPGYSKSWLPVVWAASIVTRARKEGKIPYDFAVKTILDELNNFRGQCGLLISYDWISVPLVYTQVVTLAVYSYFFSCMMGRQWLYPDASDSGVQTVKNKAGELDLVFPFFTTLQFFFYMGWLKVAESLLNPFGDDDDDFELNWMVDRNLQVSYLIVDEMHHEHPELLKDQYWDEVFPQELPHTVASEQYNDVPPTHSTDKIKVSKVDGEIVSPPSVKLDDLSESGDIGRRVSRATSGSRGLGSISSRRERTASVRSNASQTTLAESVSGKLSRASSIASVFRRMLSREKDPTMSSSHGRLHEAISTTNVPRNVVEDVIPELDENMTTIISMRPDKKPTVQEIFGTTPKLLPLEEKFIGSSSSTPHLDEIIEKEEYFPSMNSPAVTPSSAPMTSWPSVESEVPLSSRTLSQESEEGSSGGGNISSIIPSSPPTESISSMSKFVPEDKDEEQIHGPSATLLDNEGDESMDDIKLTSSSPLHGEKFSKKLSKTFGFKDKKLEDPKCEEHLLSNVSSTSSTRSAKNDE